MNNNYEKIASLLLQQVSGGWNKIELNCEFFGDAAEFDIECEHSDGQVKDLHGGYNLFKEFEKLYKVTTQNPKNNWNRAKFTLEPDGNFDIEFEWDQDLADEIERLNKED